MTSLSRRRPGSREILPLRLTLAAVLAPLMPGAAALAQELESEDPFAAPPAPAAKRTQYEIKGRVNYQFGGGEFDVLRAGARFELDHGFSPDVSLGLRLDYSYNDYDFGDDAGLAPDAWDAIHRLRFGLALDVALDDQWHVFGGAFINIAREGTIEFDKLDESLVGGGFIGGSIQVDESLFVGLGVGASDELQDPVRWFPVILLDWDITNNLRFSTRTVSATEQRIELVYGLTQNTDLAVGGGYFFSRFRLDDSGPAPDGVGEDRGYPIAFQVTHRFSPNFNVSVQTGIVVGGQLELEDADGATSKEDYGTAGFVGLVARYTF